MPRIANSPSFRNNHIMGDLSPEILAQMEEAVRYAMSNVRDREAMRVACAEMDQISDEVHCKHGVLDIGVSAIRELRDAE